MEALVISNDPEAAPGGGVPGEHAASQASDEAIIASASLFIVVHRVRAQWMNVSRKRRRPTMCAGGLPGYGAWRLLAASRYRNSSARVAAAREVSSAWS